MEVADNFSRLNYSAIQLAATNRIEGLMPYLLSLAGGHTRDYYELDFPGKSFGAGATCDYQIPSRSGRAFEIRFRNFEFILVPGGDEPVLLRRNGRAGNAVRFPKTMPLVDGDSLALGPLEFRFVQQLPAITPGDSLPTASLKNLELRAKLYKQSRGFFDERGFWEADPPILSKETVVDRYIDPFPMPWDDDSCQPPRHWSGTLDSHSGCRWLSTSPEPHLKRMLAAGAKAVYCLSHCFRIGERGSRHNPEFTMLEWLRAGDTYQQGMDLLADFAAEVFSLQVKRRSYRDAVHEIAGIDPLTASFHQLREVAGRHARHEELPHLGNDSDGWLHWLLSMVVEPKLGVEQPEIIYDFPVSQAALAQIRAVDNDSGPPVTERFELFYRGMELANGYHELTDAQELARRQQTSAERRSTDGSRPLTPPNRLIRATASGYPDSCGVAVGIDRILMLLAGATQIDEVIAFPIDRA